MTTGVSSSPDSRHTSIVRIGGVALIAGAVAFMVVFSILAARFNYPEVLDGRAADVLPALLATGNSGRAVWAVYALLPLLWIPAGVGAFYALRAKSEGALRTGMLLATVSSIGMIAGLMRWPSFHWELARAWETSGPDARPVLAAVFNATNLYLGNYVGEFLGELAINMFFLLCAGAMLERDSGFARWVGWLGMVTGACGLIGLWRNVFAVVGPVAEVNNYLLPIWMIVFGLGLLRFRAQSIVALSPVPDVA